METQKRMVLQFSHAQRKQYFAAFLIAVVVLTTQAPIALSEDLEVSVEHVEEIVVTPTPTVTPEEDFTPTPTVTPDQQLGSIRICKMIMDAHSNVVDGSQVSGTVFEISGITPGVSSLGAPVDEFGTATFTTPLTFNTQLLSGSEDDDANCVTYSNLPLGGYYYAEESISGPGSNWLSPKYNDQYQTNVTTLEDFFDFDANLYDGDGSNDLARNQDSDGHLNLTPERPDRTLVVLNRLPESFAGGVTVCKIVLDGVQCEPWADEVVSFSQGLRSDGAPVVAERSDATKALGLAQDNDTDNFVSLGFGGELILGFTNYAINGDGDDIALTETSFGGVDCSQYPEKAHVYASQDGASWTDLGTGCLDSTFDLGPLPWARYVKIVDITNPLDFQGPTPVDGFDVDGVMALHCQSFAPGTAFTVESIVPPISSVLPPVSTFTTSVFTMPLSYTTDILYDDGILDAQCYDYDNLPLGGYHYGEESISPSYGWGDPLYNDTYTIGSSGLNPTEHFFPYDGNLYDGDPSNDESREQNADGHFNLTAERPHRVLIVLNQTVIPTTSPLVTPTPTITPTPTVTPNGDGETQELVIFNEKATRLSSTSAEITWDTNHPATSRVVYDLVAHAVPGTPPNYDYASSNVEDPTLVITHSMTITDLTPDTVYYFRPVSHGSPEVVGIEVSIGVNTPTPTPTPNGGTGGGSPITISSGGGSGSGSGSGSTPTPTPSVTPDPNGGAGGTGPQVAGAETTNLPATGFGPRDALMFGLFSSLAALGSFLLLASYGLLPQKVLHKLK